MKICQVAPLVESVPPRGYGGTERVVYWLTEELVRRGHDVTLYASNDSITSARLAKTHTAALRPRIDCLQYTGHHLVMLEQVFKAQMQFDIIHSHVEYLFFPWARRATSPCITTIHNAVEPGLQAYREYCELPLVSISKDQRAPYSELNWYGTIYHGMPKNLFTANYSPQDYLLFLGRFSPEKSPHLAIEIARKSGHAIKLAAKLDQNQRDLEYFESMLKPMLALPGVEYLGEVGDSEKKELLANAKAMVFPITWSEPFGLVMIEALASGTPVIAFARGSVPEVIEHGKTGFLCRNTDDAAAMINQIDTIDRRMCRDQFEKRFSVEAMADGYLRAYNTLICRRPLSIAS